MNFFEFFYDPDPNWAKAKNPGTGSKFNVLYGWMNNTA